jgi:hypothetical protein
MRPNAGGRPLFLQGTRQMHKMHKLIIGVLMAAVLGWGQAPALAQGQSSAQPASARADQLLKPEELDQLVAPIALYPDTLLAEVLMASTYPLEVVEAERWAEKNKNLKGDQLKAEVDKQSWDDSVKSLVATPDVLSMLSTQLDWTQKLGDAVLAQQPDVMDAIQRLRVRAEDNKKLESSKEQKVVKKQEGGKQVIIIEQASPDTVYVPYYEPAVVYGAWPYAAYPPFYFPPPGYIAANVIRTGIAFGAGYAVGRWASGGYYWGGGFGWGGNNIHVNNSTNINVNVNNWQHNPAHRQGVKYNNAKVNARFGDNKLQAGRNDRLDFRGRGGEQVLKPDFNRPNLGDRKPGERPNLGDRKPGDRANIGDRKPDRSKIADRTPAKRPGGDARPAKRPAAGHGNSAFGDIKSGKVTKLNSERGKASINKAGARPHGGGGAPRARAGGGGRPGGGGGGHRGGGRRR